MGNLRVCICCCGERVFYVSGVGSRFVCFEKPDK